MTDAEDNAELELELEESAEPAAELDPETRARRDAALRHVRKLGDPVLRASAVVVDRFDESLRAEIEHMGELMHDALGIGLAATQIGVLHRVLVYRVHGEDEVTALVNPVLEWVSDELEVAEEGCLSLPGVHIEVERPAQLKVRARDGAGEEVLIEAEGLEARVIQHEIDHLDGILILDRVPRAVRKEAMRALREAQRAEARGETALQSGTAPQGETEASETPQGETAQGETSQRASSDRSASLA
jgi:peptide deformylase